MTQVVIYKVLKFGYNQKELEGLVIKNGKKTEIFDDRKNITRSESNITRVYDYDLQSNLNRLINNQYGSDNNQDEKSDEESDD